MNALRGIEVTPDFVATAYRSLLWQSAFYLGVTALGLALAVLVIRFSVRSKAWKSLMQRAKENPEEDVRDDPLVILWIGGLVIIGLVAVVLFCLVWFNPWTWAAMFDPQALLAHKGLRLIVK